MRRFFAESMDMGEDTVIITGDEARHIETVLRMKPGDRVLLINGEGTECEAEIVSCSDGAVSLNILERQIAASEPSVHVTLFQCLPKQGKMELIIQKCVELGVYGVVPTIAKRCVVKIDGKDGKLIRWNKVSKEAAKQCGRAFVPAVSAPLKLETADFSSYDTVLIPYENEGETSLKAVLKSRTGMENIAVIIGPEGGFEPAEVERIIDRGGIAVSLGPRILRTETAGMACLAQIMYELEQ